jgi:alkanesulfonate monooxygenase SsuD/methylene tetrahydromethanopterin reductase-like flavin-dependent oxidoreductase (luciferase family)
MPFDERGARTDEHIEVLKALWTQDEASYSGRFFTLPPVRSEPRPVQKPHPPVWVGGHEPGALRRAAKYGDGWHAYRLRAGEIAEKSAYIKQKAEESGREPAAIQLSVRAPLILSDSSLSIDRAFAGTEDEVKAQLQAFRDVGVEYVVFEPPLLEGIDRAIAACERFATKVAPAFGP